MRITDILVRGRTLCSDDQIASAPFVSACEVNQGIKRASTALLRSGHRQGANGMRITSGRDKRDHDSVEVLQMNVLVSLLSARRLSDYLVENR